jgi:hypothetical protein
LDTGIVTTAIILIIGYMIVSRLVGFAFRFALPLALIVLLGGAGVFSGLMPERAQEFDPADRNASYGPSQHHRSGSDIGDLRLRELADMAVRAVRSVLQGSLALFNGISESEPSRAPYGSIEPRHPSRGEYREARPEGNHDWGQLGRQERW